MIKELSIKNFRSIREATLSLGKFTVLNGANNSGKSSVLYALQVMKNVVANPNRSVDELLNLGFLNLGGLDEICYNMNSSIAKVEIQISATKEVENNDVRMDTVFGIGFSNLRNELFIKGITPYKFSGLLSISFPYPLNKSLDIEFYENNKLLGKLAWNGHISKNVIASRRDQRNAMRDEANLPLEEINQCDVIPTRRGFSKPIFNQVPMNASIYSEDEAATHLAIDKALQAKVAHYFEKSTGKRFSVSMGPGGGFFYLQVREPDTPFATELVNQGMGVNQILFMLAKILYDKNRLICIDEPEIHLHPALIEQFVRVLVEIAEKEDKQFIFSTHSEHWMMSLLAEVYEKNLTANALKVYYLYKKGPETIVEPQKVHSNGQIEGGLKNFMEAQLRLANRFFPSETIA